VAAYLPALAPDGLGIPKAPQRGLARVGGTHPGVDEALRLHLEVRRDLLVHLALGRNCPEHPAGPPACA
jgi:hypothetical protein